MKVPFWAQKYLRDSQATEVEASLKSAEEKTCAEFVIVVAQSSAPFGHVFPMLLIAIAALVWIFRPLPELLFSIFDFSASNVSLSSLELTAQLLSLPVSALIAYWLSRRSFFQRLLIRDQDEVAMVERMAELEFHRQGIVQASSRSGVLIYISLMEHRVVILEDPLVKEKVGEKILPLRVKELVEAIRKGELSRGLQECLQALALELAPQLPVATTDRNELSNLLIYRKNF